MKRALLTGGTGFVGANLARRLLRDGHEVHLLVRPGHRPWRLAGLTGRVHLHAADLADADAVVRAVRPQWVFHLAAHGAYPEQTDFRQMVRTNVAGTVALVEACLRTGFEAFVHAGSSSEYGFKDHAPGEDEAPEPNSHYAVTKAAATHYCSHVAHSQRVPLVTLRLYSVYGPFEEPTRLIPTLIRHGLRGELPPLVNPEICRDFVYVEDVCEAFILAARGAREPGTVYNVGSGVQVRLREVVDLARRLLNVRNEPRWGSMPNRAWDTTVWVADARRIRRELGWQPRYTLADGLRLTVEWVRSHPIVLDREACSRQDEILRMT
jgi:dolichol-phosphate mannosyltransferase